STYSPVKWSIVPHMPLSMSGAASTEPEPPPQPPIAKRNTILVVVMRSCLDRRPRLLQVRSLLSYGLGVPREVRIHQTNSVRPLIARKRYRAAPERLTLHRGRTLRELAEEPLTPAIGLTAIHHDDGEASGGTCRPLRQA